MMRKKTLATLLTLTMLTTAAVPVFAAEGDSESTATELQYTPTPNTYTFLIPETTDITAVDGTDIGVEDVLLEDGKILTVSIGNSTNGFQLKDDIGGGSVGYTITEKGKTEPLTTNSPILTVASGKGGGTVTLTFKADKKPTKVGTYTDQLTFTAAITTPAGE